MMTEVADANSNNSLKSIYLSVILNADAMVDQNNTASRVNMYDFLVLFTGQKYANVKNF